MIRAVVSARVNASADSVRRLYGDPAHWAALFPATIRSAEKPAEVSHVEGRVINILRPISPARIDLTEFKRRYTARFTNEFIPDGEGMC